MKAPSSYHSPQDQAAVSCFTQTNSRLSRVLEYFFYCYFRLKIFSAFLPFCEKQSQGLSAVGECAFLMVADLQY